MRNCLTRNNLFIGTGGDYAFDSLAPMTDCDFDFDGFGGGPFRIFLRWNGKRYATPEEARRRSPAEKHAIMVENAKVFASGALPPSDVNNQVAEAVDLRLKAASSAIDAGAVLPGLNDGFRGRRPDLGAYELGEPLPQYGPRMRGSAG